MAAGPSQVPAGASNATSTRFAPVTLPKVKPPSVMKSTGALSLPGATPTTTSRDASRPAGARMSSAVRWAPRKLDALAAARINGSRSPNWAVTIGAGFISAPTNMTSALPLGADSDPKATLTTPTMTNALPWSEFLDLGLTGLTTLTPGADISGGLRPSSISRRDWLAHFSRLGSRGPSQEEQIALQGRSAPVRRCRRARPR